MYIWVVLVTFIVALTGYNLAYRSDIREFTDEPIAEAVASKIVVRHRAAMAYMKDHTPPENALTVVNFVEGALEFDDLADYLPYGYTEAAISEYVTTVYCVDKNSSGQDTYLDCTDQNATAYIATYGCLSAKWLNFTTGLPKKEFLAAAGKLNAGKRLGYAVYLTIDDAPNTMGSKMYIRGLGVKGSPIPNYLAETNVGASGESFAEVCGDNRPSTGACDYCMVYLSAFSK